jgi:D-alanine-D-alanine ligase
LAKLAHTTLGLRHYSRSDFIVAKDGIYFLEVNTLPGLTEQSLVPKALHAVGATMSDFLDHLLTAAQSKRPRTMA